MATKESEMTAEEAIQAWSDTPACPECGGRGGHRVYCSLIDFDSALKPDPDDLVNAEKSVMAPNQLNPRSLAPVRPEYRAEKPERWVDTNRCTEHFHFFKRDEAGNLQGWHGDDQVCESIEFNLKAEAA